LLGLKNGWQQKGEKIKDKIFSQLVRCDIAREEIVSWFVALS
jgi:hypothetical protein